MIPALEKPWGNGRGPGIIPCLSMQQPFATAILYVKDIENRARKIFTVPPGGLWVCIHASKTEYGENEADRQAVWEYMRNEQWPAVPVRAALPRGSIIGAVFFDWSEDQADDPSFDPVVSARQDVMDESIWTTAGSHCYHVAKRRPLATPVPALGALGLWGAPPGVAAAIRERLPGLWPAEGT